LGGTEFSVTRPAVTGKLGYIMLTCSTNYIREVMTKETKKKRNTTKEERPKKSVNKERERREK
jgi:hypothetical protein